MLGRFGSNAGSLLGVEIASDSVRMLYLRRQRGRLAVAGWACQALPSGARSVDPAEADGPLLDALRRAHERCATRQYRVAVALPASQVICKRCQVPRGLDEDDTEAWLLARAEQLFPFALDDLALDFHEQGVSASDPGLMDVVVAACRQSQLDPLQALFEQVGLEVAAIEPDSLALRRLLSASASEQRAWVQLEAGEVVLHRWDHDGLPLRDQLACMAPALWLDRVSELWQAGECGGVCKELVLSGADADSDKVAQLAERLGVSCGLVSLPLTADPAAPSGARMALACGLALGGLH